MLYFRYINRPRPDSAFWSRRHASGRYTYPTPGHLGHKRQLVRRGRSRIVGRLIFDRHCGQWTTGAPQKRSGLYWRTHPEFEQGGGFGPTWQGMGPHL